MASVSSTTSSLSGTLRGFGGMASGIDRDSIIEQMSLGTNTKIQNQKNAITSLTWKQEAFRSIIDKILDLQDNYLSYAATSSVMDSSLFAKSVITANGDEKISKYVSVSGSSDLLESMSVKGVSQLASAANVQSKAMESGAIETEMSYSSQPKTSNLSGTKLVFGHYGHEDKFYENGTFTFPTSYKDENNKTVDINYIAESKEDFEKLAADLNKAIEMNKFKLSDDVTIQFEADGTNLKMHYATVKGGDANYKIDDSADGRTKAAGLAKTNGFVIRDASSALSALGFDKDHTDDSDPDNPVEAVSGEKGYTLEEYNSHVVDTKKSSIHIYDNMADYLKGRKFTVTYGGQSKQVELITEADAKELSEAAAGADLDDLFAKKMEKNLAKAFGTGKITVSADADTGKISFSDAKKEGATLTINSSDYAVRKETGLDKMSSNKVSLDSSLYDNRTRFFGKDAADWTKDEFAAKLENFTINDVKINATADMTVNQLLHNINSSEAGVKATYLNTSNKFTLVSKETGSGRKISLGGGAEEIFGGESVDGEDAVMYVDYGTGSAERIVSSSNTFDMDGLKITVSGEFGIAKNSAGQQWRSAGSNGRGDPPI